MKRVLIRFSVVLTVLWVGFFFFIAFFTSNQNIYRNIKGFLMVAGGVCWYGEHYFTLCFGINNDKGFI